MQIWRHFFSQIIVFSKEKIDSEAKIAYYLRKKTINACIYQKLLLILQPNLRRYRFTRWTGVGSLHIYNRQNELYIF